MIKADELRVNNILIREIRNQRGMEYENPFILTGEWMGKLFGSDLSIASQDLDGIPLTHDIWLKAGFEISKGTITGVIHYVKGDIKFIVKDGGYCFYGYSKCCIHHLHELQNLYHSLTGAELEINL